MMMTGSWGESCESAAVKYAAMIPSNKNMLFLLKVDLTYTAREERRRPGTVLRPCSPDRARGEPKRCGQTYDSSRSGFGDRLDLDSGRLFQ
jgi:hypothetical protein